MSRYQALGNFVYENGNRIGCTVEEATVEIARKLNAYQMRIERLKQENKRLIAEVERLTKAIDLTIIDLDERHERQDLRAWEFAELLRKAKGVQS